MDERLRFVARLLDGEKMAALCREFNVWLCPFRWCRKHEVMSSVLPPSLLPTVKLTPVLPAA